MSPFGATAAPLNFPMLEIVELMSTQLNTLDIASNVPMQSALRGGNTISPFGATAVPRNFLSVLSVDVMSVQLNGNVNANVNKTYV